MSAGVINICGAPMCAALNIRNAPLDWREAIMPSTDLVIAGEANKPINWWANPQPPAQPAENPISLTGAAVTMKILNTTTGDEETVDMTPSEDGTYATYPNADGYLAMSAQYQLQMWAMLAGGVLLKTPIRILNVRPTL
jgi:hypothetical protein